MPKLIRTDYTVIEENGRIINYFEGLTEAQAIRLSKKPLHRIYEYPAAKSQPKTPAPGKGQ